MCGAVAGSPRPWEQAEGGVRCGASKEGEHTAGTINIRNYAKLLKRNENDGSKCGTVKTVRASAGFFLSHPLVDLARKMSMTALPGRWM